MSVRSRGPSLAPDGEPANATLEARSVRARAEPSPKQTPSVGQDSGGNGDLVAVGGSDPRLEAYRIRQADTARTEQFVVAISPRALRMLAAVAKHRDMSCEALAREYLSDGIRKDRMEQFYVTASMTMREVLQELAPERAEELLAEFSRRLREQAGNP